MDKVKVMNAIFFMINGGLGISFIYISKYKLNKLEIDFLVLGLLFIANCIGYGINYYLNLKE